MSSTLKFRYLNQEDVIEAGGLNMAETLASVERAMSMATQGEAVEPLMPSVAWDGGEGQRLAAHMAALGGGVSRAFILWECSNPTNPVWRNAPRSTVVYMLTDPSSGFPLALMDGTLINAMTTGAIGGVAAKYLARADSSVLGVVGLGVINRAQVMALGEVLDQIERVKAFDPNMERAQVFAKEMGARLSWPVEVVESAEEAVVGCDVVAVATGVADPADSYVEASWIKEGAFFSQMSPYDAQLDAIRTADKHVLDTLQQLDCEDRGLGMFCAQGLLERQWFLDLRQIIVGEQVGREDEAETVFFKSWGVMVNQLLEAERIYERAAVEGIGQILELWHDPYWI